MKVRRGARLPKRLIEVTFGSVVGQVLPDAVLWASTYRPTDGVGIRPSANRLLFQCSPADERLKGFSTRINRKMLASFTNQAPLRAWGHHAQFILVSARDDWRDIGERRELELWAIAAADLQEFTEDRMRGTVDRRDLEHLAAAGYARPLRELLTLFAQNVASPNHLSPKSDEIDAGPQSELGGSFLLGLWNELTYSGSGSPRFARRYVTPVLSVRWRSCLTTTTMSRCLRAERESTEL
jgi:hypothetical protein